MGGQNGPGVGWGHGAGWDDMPHVVRSWWGGWEMVLLALLLAALIGVVIWGVLRMSRTPVVGSAPIAPRPDGALSELRLRYARGEVDRETFLQASRDLGADVAPTPPIPMQETAETPEAP